MGTLVPSDFDLDGLVESERRVVRALLDGTDESWLILPNVPFVDKGSDGEADVVAIHPGRGVVVIEVKGGVISRRGGVWHQYERPLSTSPVDQAIRAKFTLMKKVRRFVDEGEGKPLFWTHALAFPDAGRIPAEWLGADLEAGQVLTAVELERPEEALTRLTRARGVPAERAVGQMVRLLRPDLEFPGISIPFDAITRRLDDKTEDVLRTAESLDCNPRVWVEGPAGTGKSRLAMRWARRASRRGERALLLCFNVPMGSVFERAFAEDERVVAGNFHDVALRFLEPTGFRAPENADREFFENAVSQALIEHRDELVVAFDTIILDEVQDIRPQWFPAIEGLLDPQGAGRIFRLGDPEQNVYGVEPDEGEGWVGVPLGTNCRNTKAIAAVAARVGGSDTFPTSPEGPPVSYRMVGGLKELRKRIGAELSTLLEEHRLPASSIAVITTRATLRDEIIAEPKADVPLVRWDHRDEGAVVCETAHRLKGTEWEAVILANLEPATTSWLSRIIYVGITRPRTWLSVVAPADTGELLGLG